MIAAGLITDAEFDGILAEVFASASPTNGARMVARALETSPVRLTAAIRTPAVAFCQASLFRSVRVRPATTSS